MRGITELIAAIREATPEPEQLRRRIRLDRTRRKWRTYANSLASALGLFAFSMNPLYSLPILAIIYPLFRVMGDELAEREVRAAEERGNPLGSTDVHLLEDSLNDDLYKMRSVILSQGLSEAETQKLLVQATEHWMQASMAARTAYLQRLGPISTDDKP